jgi:hypothetical protein
MKLQENGLVEMLYQVVLITHIHILFYLMIFLLCQAVRRGIVVN